MEISLGSQECSYVMIGGSVKWTPLSRQLLSEFKLRPSLQSQRSSAALF